MTPFDDFAYIINHVLLGDEPTIEDFILLVGTLVAFIAFILWCCFPIQTKDTNTHRQVCGNSLQNSFESQLQQQHSGSSGGGGGGGSGNSNNYSKTIDYSIKNGHHCYT